MGQDKGRGRAWRHGGGVGEEAGVGSRCCLRVIVPEASCGASLTRASFLSTIVML